MDIIEEEKVAVTEPEIPEIPDIPEEPRDYLPITRETQEILNKEFGAPVRDMDIEFLDDLLKNMRVSEKENRAHEEKSMFDEQLGRFLDPSDPSDVERLSKRNVSIYKRQQSDPATWNRETCLIFNENAPELTPEQKKTLITLKSSVDGLLPLDPRILRDAADIGGIKFDQILLNTPLVNIAIPTPGLYSFVIGPSLPVPVYSDSFCVLKYYMLAIWALSFNPLVMTKGRFLEHVYRNAVTNDKDNLLPLQVKDLLLRPDCCIYRDYDFVAKFLQKATEKALVDEENDGIISSLFREKIERVVPDDICAFVSSVENGIFAPLCPQLVFDVPVQTQAPAPDPGPSPDPDPNKNENERQNQPQNVAVPSFSIQMADAIIDDLNERKKNLFQKGTLDFYCPCPNGVAIDLCYAFATSKAFASHIIPDDPNARLAFANAVEINRRITVALVCLYEECIAKLIVMAAGRLDFLKTGRSLCTVNFRPINESLVSETTKRDVAVTREKMGLARLLYAQGQEQGQIDPSIFGSINACTGDASDFEALFQFCAFVQPDDRDSAIKKMRQVEDFLVEFYDEDASHANACTSGAIPVVSSEMIQTTPDILDMLPYVPNTHPPLHMHEWSVKKQNAEKGQTILDFGETWYFEGKWDSNNLPPVAKKGIHKDFKRPLYARIMVASRTVARRINASANANADHGQVQILPAMAIRHPVLNENAQKCVFCGKHFATSIYQSLTDKFTWTSALPHYILQHDVQLSEKAFRYFENIEK